jgi:hypothetical protein
MRERDGGTASLFDPGDYPLAAACMTCGRPIRALAMYGTAGDWEHSGGGAAVTFIHRPPETRRLS